MLTFYHLAAPKLFSYFLNCCRCTVNSTSEVVTSLDVLKNFKNPEDNLKVLGHRCYIQNF